MKCAWFVCLVLLMTKVGIAQDVQDTCREFSRLMREADSFARQKDFRKALNKYNSAKTCSPSSRTEVDKKINKLFEHIQAEMIKAQAAESSQRRLYKEYRTMIESNAKAIEAKKKSDSGYVAHSFSVDNKDWLLKLPDEVQKQLLTDVVRLNETGRRTVCDSLASAFKQLVLANDWIKDYNNCQSANEQTLNAIKLAGESAYIPFYGLRLLEDYYNLAAFRLENANELLPSWERSAYGAQVRATEKSLQNVRIAATRDYHIPDTVIGLPSDHWLYGRCANNKDFVIAFLDYRDYNKLQLHYINYSLPNFAPTIDSLEVVADSGKLYRRLAASANFKNTVRTAVTYTLKKNRVQITDSFRIVPNSTALFDSAGNIITQFAEDPGTAHYFSPDGNLVITWRPDTSLVLYNILLKKLVRLTDDNYVRAVNISADSRTITYYNPGTRTIYFSGTDGRLLFRIPLAELGLKDLDDLDFAGNDQFLRIRAASSILLVHIPERKILLSFSSQRVQDIVVSPSGKDILLNCNVTYTTSSNNSSGPTRHYENLVLIVDENLHIKGKLLGDVQHLFFTPDGSYVIGYDDKTLVRWSVDSSIGVDSNTYVPGIDQTFLSIEELIDNSYFPYSRYASINDANQIQRGAYNLVRNMTASELDTLVKGLYYRQAENLFNRLAFGNAQNILPQNIPFFHDWCNWIEQRLGNKDFSALFSRQQVGTELFDKMVNTKDSVYPQQLFYAANSHMIFGGLYDSLRYYNSTYLDLIRDEIALRQRVLLKDPDNSDNIYYLRKAYLKFDTVCNIMGDNFSKNKQYSDRLALFRMEEEYFSNRRQQFYDRYSERDIAYTNALTQLATSFIYVYVSASNESKTALDSASYYANKGLQIAPNQVYAAYFVMEDAFAHLLNDEVEKSIDACRTARGHHPEIDKETMRQAFQFFKHAVGSAGPSANIDRLEKCVEQRE